ncbi:hypothetical protein SAMN05216309_11615 [Nitrosomonas europaea]|nr:hypothetical protein SAMN05216310_11515 [Nitrosomonas europaea]SET05481.1 hypothetical protein SAMN05216309_11615 [Nitrosomonas europaea]SJZ57165.1 hypothetical protein SAMN02745113_01307 [Nitrosomonas europaea]
MVMDGIVFILPQYMQMQRYISMKSIAAILIYEQQLLTRAHEQLQQDLYRTWQIR